MQTLLFAILTASLLGSVHCAGMCGPFVLLSVGGSSRPGKGSLLGLSLYHLGRLGSYLALGAMAGFLGSAIDFGGKWAGIGKSAAIFAGILMIIFGIWALLQLWGVGSVHLRMPAKMQKLVQAGYRKSQKLPIGLRGGLIGILSVLIPCGWLYAFVITAAGTANAFSGVVVMFAFWLGTVPILSAVGLSVQSISVRVRKMLPYVTAFSIIALGFYTVSVRAFADYSTLQQKSSQVAPEENSLDQQIERVKSLPDEVPPCCRVKEE